MVFNLNIYHRYKFIPYDEIYFGKPYANFYIDDLAINPSISMNQAIGVYDTEIAPRTFNKVDFPVPL